MTCVSNSSGTACVNCGWKKPEKIIGWPQHNCSAVKDKAPKGPGDFLHDCFVRYFGEGVSERCGCKSKILEMNQLGPAGCREKLTELTAYVVKKADEKKWFDEPTAENKRRFRWWKLATKLPGKTIAIEMMILHAIKKAEKEAAKATVTRCGDS